MLPLAATVVLIYFASCLILPFPHWPSLFIVLREVLRTADATFRQKSSMLSHLLKDVLLLPVFAALWSADELFFAGYRNVTIREPVFIMSQPRSGTTFLLRTLSQDRDTFLSVKHLEWRYPFICFWKLVALDYAVLFEDNEEHASKRTEFMKEHLAFLEANAARIAAAGPLKDAKTGSPAGGLWLVKADSLDDVMSLLEADPFWPTGLRKSIKILVWTMVYADGIRRLDPQVSDSAGSSVPAAR